MLSISSERGEADGTKGDFNSNPRYVVVKFIIFAIGDW
jgi:hypothetical protein